MPWHQSMLGVRDYNESDIKPCAVENGYMLYRLDYEFLSNATKFMVPTCHGKQIKLVVKNRNCNGDFLCLKILCIIEHLIMIIIQLVFILL